MGLVDELNKLSEMHAAGQLTDAEFDDAKTKLIRDFTGTGGGSVGTSGGDTAGGMATSVAPEPPPPDEPPPGTFQPTTTVKPAGTAGSSAPPAPPSTGAGPAGSQTAGSQPGVVPGSYGARPATAPTTTIRSGLGTGSVMLGGTPSTTRLRGSAAGLTRAERPPRSIFWSFVVLLIPVLFCSLMLSTAGLAIFPGLARLTAPVLCEAPFDHSYVEITTTPGDEAGETNINWTLLCYNDRGRTQDKGTFEPMAIFFVGSTIVFFLIGAFFIVIGRLRRRRRRDDIQVDPEVSDSVLSGSGGPIVDLPS